jgi:hypothetical protein
MAEEPTRRDAEGRWLKGVSGNPAGRPMGSLNRALLAQAILSEYTSILTTRAIDKAISGDSVSLRFFVGRLLAPRRSSPVELALPPIETQQDAALAMAAVSRAAAVGGRIIAGGRKGGPRHRGARSRTPG